MDLIGTKCLILQLTNASYFLFFCRTLWTPQGLSPSVATENFSSTVWGQDSGGTIAAGQECMNREDEEKYDSRRKYDSRTEGVQLKYGASN